jgi:hypothetical protein
MHLSHKIWLLVLGSVIAAWSTNLVMPQGRTRQPPPAESSKPSDPTNNSAASQKTRVNVKLRDGDNISGTLIQADSRVIKIEVGGNPVTIAIGKVASIEFISNDDKVKTSSVVSAPSPSPNPPQSTPTPSRMEAATELVGTWNLRLVHPMLQAMRTKLIFTSEEKEVRAVLEMGDQRVAPSKVGFEQGKFNVTFPYIEQGRTTLITFTGTGTRDEVRGELTSNLTGSSVRFEGVRVRPEKPDASIGSGSLVLQAGIVYKMGGAQAVARTNFHLLDRSLATILDEAGLQADHGMNIVQTFGFASRFQSLGKYASFYNAAIQAIRPHIVASTTTDFNGFARFPAVTAGSYYVMGYSETKGGFVVWDVQVGIPTGESSIVLDQNNAAIAL